MDLDPHRFNLSVKLNQIETAFIGSQLLHKVACSIQRVGKLTKPARPLRCGTVIRYSIHSTPRP